MKLRIQYVFYLLAASSNLLVWVVQIFRSGIKDAQKNLHRNQVIFQ